MSCMYYNHDVTTAQTQTISLRLRSDLATQLRRRAKAQAGTVSGLIQAMIDEGLRMRDLPGITFRDGPAGRRAAVAGGPDVWEIIAALKADAPGDGVVEEVAADMGWPTPMIEVALAYYSRYPDEIDDWIAENERQAQASFEAWTRRQKVLA